MKRLVYQVCLGKAKNSKLYKHCINSVAEYCKKYGFTHMVQTTPIVNIRPDPFQSNRSEDSWKKHGGFLPIYEKENAFSFMNEFDQIAIIDADIFIRDYTPNIFDDFGTDHAFGAVCERGMNISQRYVDKIKNYSHMQYSTLQCNNIDFKPNERGFEFFNMGMILINSSLFRPYLNNQTPAEFIQRYEFMDFVNGKGPWKWSTDQTLLNYFLKKYKVPTKHMNQKWNGLFTANEDISTCHFVHYFLKDLLPNKGEDVDKLMELI